MFYENQVVLDKNLLFTKMQIKKFTIQKSSKNISSIIDDDGKSYNVNNINLITVIDAKSILMKNYFKISKQLHELDKTINSLSEIKDKHYIIPQKGEEIDN